MRHWLSATLIGVALSGCGSVVPQGAMVPAAGVQSLDVSPAKIDQVATFFIEKYGRYDTTSAERLSILKSLGRINSKKAADFLIGVYGRYDTTAEMRLVIIEGLGYTRQDAAVDFLINLHGRYDATAALKVAIVESLSRLASSQAAGTISMGTSRRSRIVTWLKQQRVKAGAPQAAIDKALAALVP